MKPDPPPSRRWRRLSVGVLMLLIAGVAVGLAAWDYAQRVRVVFTNRSGKIIRIVSIEHEGRTTEFGPVPPRTSVERRVKSALMGPIHLAFDVVDGHGRPDRHIAAPGVTASGRGDVVDIKFDGP